VAIKNTIADNHLSSSAKKGRYGDTEILRFSGGERAHGNIKEKALINMYGQQGEQMVKAAGSGSTNPSTGLQEYFDPFTIASLGLGAISAYQGGKTASTQARYESQAAAQGLQSLEGASEQLETAVGTRREAAEQDYTMGQEQLSAETGIAKEDLSKQTEQTIQKSGLATSGSIEEERSGMWRRIQGAFGRGKSNLMADLGKKMGDIEGWYEGEKARIKTERQKFERMRSLAKEQEGAWYLGKNLFG
jgi:hypothetical protein